MRAPSSTIVILSCLYVLVTVDAQDIKPLGGGDEETEGTNFVDLSGLGGDSAYYKKDMLTIQLMEHLPVWTVYNLNYGGSSDYFSGLSTDGKTWARFKTRTYENGWVITRGAIQNNGIIYDVKPDWLGRDRVTEVRDRDLPPHGDPPFPLLGQLWTFAKNPWGVGKATLKSLGWRLQSFISPKTTAELARNDATIDLMIIWTPNAECKNSFAGIDCTLTDQTRANMELDIGFWVADTNTAYSNSGTGVTFNVVHQQLDDSSYRETAEASFILDHLTDLCHPQLGYIHSLRDQYEADLVTLIATTLDLSSCPVCGVAWVCSNSCYGFSVNDILCTSTLTPAHEFGHNFGCLHDRGTSSRWCADACTNTCQTNFGYRVPGQYRTIMSYGCDWSEYTAQCDGETTESCSQIPYFSGDYEYNGMSLGGTENNCRAQIIKTKAAIAGFR